VSPCLRGDIGFAASDKAQIPHVPVPSAAKAFTQRHGTHAMDAANPLFFKQL